MLPLFSNSSPKLWELLALFLRGPRDAIAIMRFGAQVVGPGKRAYRAGELDRGGQSVQRAKAAL